MYYSRALLRVPGRRVDFTMGFSAEVQLRVGACYFWREQNWDVGPLT